MAKTNSLKLGIFVTVAFILFIYALLRVSEGFDLFGNTITVYATFEDVKGLKVGNNVRFSGIGIGEVKAITIENDTTLKVQMELDATVQQFLRKNATIDISTDGLVGNMLVTLGPGEGTADLIEEDDVLVSHPKAEIGEMLDELSNTNLKIAAIADNLLEATTRLNQGQGALGAMLNDQALANNLLATSESLRESTRSLNRASQDVSQILAGISRGEGNLGYLLKEEGVEEEIARLGDNLDTLLRVKTEYIFQDLQATSAKLLASSEKVELMMERLTQEDGVLRALTMDTLAANNLRATLANLEEGTETFAVNMQALQSNWFFRGYFKRQAKRAKKEAKKSND